MEARKDSGKRPVPQSTGIDEPMRTKKVGFQGRCCHLMDNKFLKSTFRKAWEDRSKFNEGDLTLDAEPFRHGQIKNFIGDLEFLESFLKELDKYEFNEKASDLFTFKQSNDLKSLEDPFILRILEYLNDVTLPLLKELTGLPLTNTIDLFLSDYEKTDFLLCHDDELDSRRIAFILYLSETWHQEFGGNLDLFSSTDEKHPSNIVKSVVPEYDKFVFFEVGATSFHQVSEVTEPNVRRLALSGWFYGEPVPRPKIVFPEDPAYDLKDNIVDVSSEVFGNTLASYLQEETLSHINEQLEEESQVLIPGFLQDSVYRKLCEDAVEKDLNNCFVCKGPPNLRKYSEMPFSFPKTASSLDGCSKLEDLVTIFHSKEFLIVLEKITELSFSENNLVKVSSSLRKFARGDYSLLKCGGAKQTGHMEAVTCTNDLDNEDEQEPNLVDVLFFIASGWDENWGGLKIYSSDDGEQLISIPPEGNSLAVVVRNNTVHSYVNYVNCNAKDEVFFVYEITYALDGQL